MPQTGGHFRAPRHQCDFELGALVGPHMRPALCWMSAIRLTQAQQVRDRQIQLGIRFLTALEAATRVARARLGSAGMVLSRFISTSTTVSPGKARMAFASCRRGGTGGSDSATAESLKRKRKPQYERPVVGSCGYSNRKPAIERRRIKQRSRNRGRATAGRPRREQTACRTNGFGHPASATRRESPRC